MAQSENLRKAREHLERAKSLRTDSEEFRRRFDEIEARKQNLKAQYAALEQEWKRVCVELGIQCDPPPDYKL